MTDSPDREAVILREIRAAFSHYSECSDAVVRDAFRIPICLADRIWSHVESLNATALVEARRAGAYEALAHYERNIRSCVCTPLTAQGVGDDVREFRARLYAPPRPAIAPVPLSGGRTLAWDGEREGYRVIRGPVATGWEGSEPDLLIHYCAYTLADARAILAFVAQVEGVAT